MIKVIPVFLHYDFPRDQRIDFTKDDWYSQFLAIRKQRAMAFLSKPNFNDINANQWIKDDNGYSVANLTNGHAVISNACIFKEYNGILLHEPIPAIIKRMHKYKHIRHAYLHEIKNYKSNSKPMKDSTYNQIMYVTLRWDKNIFHQLEGLSSIIRLAAHPEIYPTIKKVIIHKKVTFTPGSWGQILEEIIFDLFDESIRPSFISENTYCEKLIVLGGSWKPYGYGSFIPEPMIADMFRAVAYKYINWHYTEPKDHKLSAFLLQRKGSRRITNSDEIFNTLSSRFRSSLNLRYFALDGLSGKEQIQLFSSLDIAIHPHGAGSTNMIYMLPNSCLFEIFPPHFYYDCYEKMAIGLDVIYKHIVASGSYPEYCRRQYLTNKCPKYHLRNRVFSASVKTIVNVIEEVIPLVQKKKYPSIWG